MFRRPSRSRREPVRAPKELIDRRRFISWIGGVAVLTACSRNPLAPVTFARTVPQLPVPRRVLPPADALNVRDYGALGDGATNDTAAFALAMSSLGTAGGTLFVPAGVYLIDPLKSVCLTDNSTLWLDSNAVLQAIPVTADYSAVVLVTNVRNARVTGGTIIGERNGHLGTTGEDGFGIWIKGSTSIMVDGVSIRDCWGDGILIGGSRLNGECRDVTVSNCVSRNNRRQGLSVLGLFGGLIEDSEFSDQNGTAPESGIDVEPSGVLSISDLTIRNCTAKRNAGYGILLCGPPVAGTNPAVSKITLDSVTCTDNALDGAGLLKGVTLSTIKGSRFERNQNNGIQLVGSSENELLSNSFYDNGLASPPLYASVRLIDGSSNNTISNNTYLPVGALPDVALITPDCLNNRVA